MRPPDHSAAAAPSDDDLAQDIRRYLDSHPHAADAPEGVADWWLPSERLRISIVQVRRVLRRLTELGVLEAVVVGRAKCYRRRALAPGEVVAVIRAPAACSEK